MGSNGERALFQHAVMASKVSCAIGAAVTGTIFILESIAIWENRREGYDLTKAQKRWRLHLAAASLCAFVLFHLDGSLTWYDWTGKDQMCADIQIPHILCYCLTKQFLYLFLYDRAKIVHDSLRLDERKMFYLRMIRWMLWLTVVAGVPTFFYWSAFIAFSGRVTAEGTCMYYSIYPEVIVAFSVSDFFLAAGMFGIFAFPLWAHVKEMTAIKSDPKVAAQLQTVIKRNLLYSSLALLSSFLCLNAEAVVMWIARDDPSPSSDYLREFGLFNISIDNWLGIVLLHMMTSAWLPSFLRSSSRSVDTDTANNGANGNGSTGEFTNKSPRSDKKTISLSQQRPASNKERDISSSGGGALVAAGGSSNVDDV